jgi:2-polyprenyl-6-hydroxyphenyl methylase / 3-demethylubiquinone-9 3-methyltransferase
MESSKLRSKRFFYPGFNLGTRSRAKIRHYMLNEPDIRTLDLGCGNGFFTAMAVKRGGTALGVSFDPAQIERCNEFKPYLGVDPAKVEFRVMNAASIQALEEKFDQILFLEVIEHIDNDVEVVGNIARLLKPGGVLQLSTPDIRWGRWTGSLDRFARGGHCRIGYSAGRLEQIIRGAGLDVSFQIKIGGLGIFLTPLQAWISRLLGNSTAGEGIAFLLVYPIYLAVKWIPICDSMRMVQFIQGRKPVSGGTP